MVLNFYKKYLNELVNQWFSKFDLYSSLSILRYYRYLDITTIILPNLAKL